MNILEIKNIFRPSGPSPPPPFCPVVLPLDPSLLNAIHFSFIESLLQKSKSRNFHLMVAHNNLKNKLKTMECEMGEVKKALSLEELQCNLLKENLDSKLVR